MALGKPPSRFNLVLSTSRLNKIVDLDVANLTVTAQAGVKLADLQDLLAGAENRCFFPPDDNLKEQADYMCSGGDYKGVFLPLDPPFPDRVTLGGIVAANSTGPKRLRYGLPTRSDPGREIREPHRRDHRHGRKNGQECQWLRRVQNHDRLPGYAGDSRRDNLSTPAAARTGCHSSGGFRNVRRSQGLCGPCSRAQSFYRRHWKS